MADLLEKIGAFLAQRGVPVEDQLWLRPSDEVVVARIPRSRVADRVGANTTSMRQLTRISQEIEKAFDIRVEFTFLGNDEEKGGLEQGLRGILESRFSSSVEVVEIYWHGPSELALTMSERSSLSERDRNVVKSIVRDYLSLAGIEAVDIRLESESLGEASLPAILRAVKIHAPASLMEVKGVLDSKGFEVASDSWLGSKLDLLRKRGLVLRKSDGGYVLSAEALRLVPHGTTRSSSDVERALALGKRRW